MTDPTLRELATVPAMDLEKRAEQMAAQDFTANNGDPALSTTESIGLWAQFDGEEKDLYRAKARQQLAEEAKRRGDHEEMRKMHDLGQAGSGARQQNILQPPAAQVAMLAALEMGSSITALLKLIDSIAPDGEDVLVAMSETELVQTEEYLRQAADRVKRAMVG
jgi:spore maturation protein CgeB